MCENVLLDTANFLPFEGRLAGVCVSADANRRKKAWRSAHNMTSLIRQNERGASTAQIPKHHLYAAKKPGKDIFQSKYVY
jgi:hypothetical protein